MNSHSTLQWYYLDEQKRIVKTEDFKIWSKHVNNRLVSKDIVYLDSKELEIVVSSVFLGFPHGLDSNSFFETAIIVKDNCTVISRSSTWEKAKEEHQKCVVKAQDYEWLIKNEIIVD